MSIHGTIVGLATTRPSNVRTVIFDLDGTLGDTLPVVVEAFQATLATFDLPILSQREIFGFFGPTEDGVVEAMFGDVWRDAIPVYYDTYQKLLCERPSPFPGIRRVLESCKDAGLRLAIVTGKSDRGAAVTVDSIGLRDCFDSIRGGSDQGVIKAKQITAILCGWGTDPSDSAYIGDHSLDVSEARRAGVMALSAGWASTVDLIAIESARPDVLFRSIDEFARWLDVEPITHEGGE
jgi:phosphoglycolate phosphatase-like HAD superfamily hydrolase